MVLRSDKATLGLYFGEGRCRLHSATCEGLPPSRQKEKTKVSSVGSHGPAASHGSFARYLRGFPQAVGVVRLLARA